MHTNYYLLQYLAQVLDAKLRGSQLITCYSQSKDELVLGIDIKGTDFFIHASLKSEFNILRFPVDMRRARKNSVELFEPILGLTINAVKIYQYERCLGIELENDYTLVFKMFNQHANVLLFQDSKVVELFKNRIKGDLQLTLSELPKAAPQGYSHFEAVQGDLKQYIPTLGPQLRKHLHQQGYQEGTSPQKWQMLQDLLDSLQNPTFYVGQQEGQPPALTTYPLQSTNYSGSDVIEALNTFYIDFINSYTLTKEKRLQISRLKQNIKKGQRYLKKVQSRFTALQDGIPYQTIADMLMAYMHLVPRGAKQVELPHFETNEPVSIKLKSDLSPQKNAEYYYRKEKNQKQELSVLEKSIKRKKQELALWLEQLQFFEQCQDLKSLRQYVKQHVAASTQSKDEALFKTFNFQGYTILIGKNARNNDLLTQKYAHKDDLWLHAKDVRGSHVIIKQQPGADFPTSVVQRAAELAAYYSKRKTDSLCPVTYTPKKYVRKPKGMAPGQVVVDREQVLLVAPRLN